MDGLDENHIRWIRLGKSYWYGNKKDDGEGKPEDRICPVTAFVVAKVQKRNMKIDYFEVPTWGFNGRRIGRCEWSLPFMIAEEYTSDDCFAQSGTTRDNLEVRLLLLAHSLDDGHTGAHFFPPDAAQDQNSVLVVPRILSPRPTRASGDPPTLPEPDSKGTITVVVTFVNETGVSGIKPIDLGLNLQANLPWDDDYDHFVKWLLDKHDKVERSTDMYLWDNHQDKLAQTWLCATLSETRGRKLFIEVAIVTRLTNKRTATKTVRPKKYPKEESADEDDSGKAARQKKSATSKKRGVTSGSKGGSTRAKKSAPSGGSGRRGRTSGMNELDGDLIENAIEAGNEAEESEQDDMMLEPGPQNRKRAGKQRDAPGAFWQGLAELRSAFPGDFTQQSQQAPASRAPRGSVADRKRLEKSQNANADAEQGEEEVEEPATPSKKNKNEGSGKESSAKRRKF